MAFHQYVYANECQDESSGPRCNRSRRSHTDNAFGPAFHPAVVVLVDDTKQMCNSRTWDISLSD